VDKNRNRYRIVTGKSYGYDIQKLCWWFPFIWYYIGFNTSYGTAEEAESDIKLIKKPKIKKPVKVLKYY